MKEIIKKLRGVNEFKGRFQCNNAVYTGSLCSFFHSTITASFFCCFVLIATSKQYFGDPIKCFTDKKADQDQFVIPEKVINSFCFMSNTYSVQFKKRLISSELINQIIYPGLGPDTGVPKHFHTYYQWVPFVLLVQAVLFKIPHMLWAYCEGGLVKSVIAELDEELELRLSNLNGSIKVRKVASYFYRRNGENMFIGFMWIFCDVLALANVFINFYLTDALLGGNFKRGIPILNWNGFDGSSNAFFPILTKCNIATYGSSGDIQKIDSLCVMSLNIFYEKIFFFIWIWFCILAPLTCVAIFMKFVQITLLKYRSESHWQNTISLPTKIPGYELTHCVSTMGFGDCVLFSLIAQNMRPLTYKTFVRDLSDQKIHCN